MTMGAAVTTTVGAFIFTILARIMWSKMAQQWDIRGSLLAVVLVVLLSWALNHGANNPFIYQSGNVWIDQANGVAIGMIVVSLLHKMSFKKAIPTIICSIVGGIAAGYIVYLLFI